MKSTTAVPVKGLSYDEMKVGSFHLSSLRSRDDDLLGLLASER